MNAKNVLFCVSSQPEWIATASQLLERQNWTPTYWITRVENHAAVESVFGDATLHRRLDLNRGLDASGSEMNSWRSVSQEFFQEGQFYISTAMEMMDRIDLGQSFRNQERKRLAVNMLSHAFDVVNDIDIAVFSVPPHAAGEYLLYAALRILGKECRIFNYTPLNEIHYISSSIADVPKSITCRYEERIAQSDYSTGEEVEHHLQSIRSASDSYKPWYTKDGQTREAKYESLQNKIANAIHSNSYQHHRFVPGQGLLNTKNKPLIKNPIRATDNEHLPRDFKLPGRPLSSPFITRREHRLYKQWAMADKIDLHQLYNSICSEVDFSTPYIYCPFHYQPESTTCPRGGYFNDHAFIIGMLADALPEGWLIYVKEHPSQYKFTHMGETARWAEYYNCMADKSCVRFVDTSTPSLKLIDNCRTLATITGAAGWEALIRGVPVLHFGHPWYKGCAGTFHVQSNSDIHSALQHITSSPPHSYDEVKAFAGVIEEHGRHMSTSPTRMQSTDPDTDLAKAFLDLLLQYEQQIS